MYFAGSGASSRSRPEASPCRPGKLVVSSKAKQYGKEFGAVKAEQEFGAVAAGTAGLLGTDEDDDFCPTCLEAYDDGKWAHEKGTAVSGGFPGREGT